jgi:hypothetical protein
MLHRYTSSEPYQGLERRSISERRMGRDRRNLIRFESFGCDRRYDQLRRQEERLWDRRLEQD